MARGYRMEIIDRRAMGEFMRSARLPADAPRVEKRPSKNRKPRGCANPKRGELTALAIASRVGVGENAVYRWEQGVAVPGLEAFVGWCLSLKRDPGETLTALLATATRGAE